MVYDDFARHRVTQHLFLNVRLTAIPFSDNTLREGSMNLGPDLHALTCTSLKMASWAADPDACENDENIKHQDRAR